MGCYPGARSEKFFGSFFQKRTILIPVGAINDRCCGGGEELDCFAALAMTGKLWVGGCYYLIAFQKNTTASGVPSAVRV